jgi:hypothetical protein
MPYHVSLYKRSPYILDVEVLDQPPEWTERFEHEGEWIMYRSMSGVPVNPDHAPSRFRVGIPAARLPDLFGLGPSLGASDLVREKIEEMEPSVHQFLPAEITAKGGERPERRYWFLHICNRVDAIDPDKSALRYDERLEKFRTDNVPGGAKPRMVLRKEAIAGMCLWIERRWSGGFFISDELSDFLTDGKRFKELAFPSGAFVGGRKRAKLESWEVFTE